MKIILKGIFIALLSISQNVRGQFVNKGEIKILTETIVSTKSNFDNQTEGILINDGDFVAFSDFNNDGVLTFSTNKKGTINFKGVNTQTISGASSAEFSKFNNIIFDNTSVQPAFHLSGDISISGVSNFLKGVIKVSESQGAIVYEKSANHINTSDDSHIDGYVERKGNEDFEFPIGNGIYFRPAQITQVVDNENKTTYVGKYFLENSDVLYSHSNKMENIQLINNKEYWTINSYDAQNVDELSKDLFIVSLSWDQSTTPDFILESLDSSKIDEGLITIVRWDKENKLWVNEGGIVELGSNGKGTVTSVSRVSGDGIFTLAKVDKKIVSTDSITVYNALSPNADGKNDFLKIEGIQNYPNNELIVFNRWGVKVFETTNYDSRGNVFKGYSEGRATINANGKLPAGTYFYILKYEMKQGNNSKNIEKSGYLYLNDN